MTTKKKKKKKERKKRRGVGKGGGRERGGNRKKKINKTESQRTYLPIDLVKPPLAYVRQEMRNSRISKELRIRVN